MIDDELPGRVADLAAARAPPRFRVAPQKR